MSDREVSAGTRAAVLPAARVRDAARGTDLKARDLMSKPAHACRPDTDLAAVSKLMFEHGCGFLPVVDGLGRVVGVITDGDVGIATARSCLPPALISAVQVMVTTIHDCLPDASVIDVLATMKRFRVRRLPVVDSARRPQGIVSISDILRSVAQSREPAAMDVIAVMAAIGIGKRPWHDSGS